jgi:hypothetical protein
VIEPRDRSRFTLEPDHVFVATLSEHLERDGLLQPHVLGAIHVTHATAPEVTEDPVPPREHVIGDE